MFTKHFLPLVFAASAILIGGAQSPQPGPTIQERLGHPASARLLIIHADDFGMSHSVNRAIEQALENGWVTSSSILVPCPWFPEAAAWARKHPEMDLGIHLDLNSEWTTFRWGPVSREAPSLLDGDGYLPLDENGVEHFVPAEVERELRAQVDRAQRAGIKLSHLDSHMGTLFRSAEFFDVYRRLGAAYRLPLLLERSAERGTMPGTNAADALVDRVLGIGPGVAAKDWLAAYEKVLAPLPPGVYQLIVHLGFDDEEMRGATADHPNWGAAWRQSDFDLVRSQAFRDFLREQKFLLVKWKDISRAEKL